MDVMTYGVVLRIYEFYDYLILLLSEYNPVQ